MKLLIICGSHRNDGNSKTVADGVGMDAKIIYLCDQNISRFRYDQSYPNADQFLSLVQQMINADEIVFVSPVYANGPSVLIQNLLERLADLTYSFPDLEKQLSGKSCSVLAHGAQEALPKSFHPIFEDTLAYHGLVCKNITYTQYE